MNLDQAATYLRVSRATLDRWIRQGLLAEAGLRGAHFERELLERWAQRRGLQVDRSKAAQPTTPENLLAEATDRGAVTLVSAVPDSKSAIEATITALDLPAAAHTRILEATLARERLAATALGHGVAVPHPREPQAPLIEAPRISVAFLDPPVDWAAVDRQPVHTAILVLSPSTPVHLQLLSRIAFALRAPGFEEFLRGRPSRDELVERLRHIHKTS